jgi:hypothetical protein
VAVTDWAAFADTCAGFVEVDLDGTAGAVAVTISFEDTRDAATRAFRGGLE